MEQQTNATKPVKLTFWRLLLYFIIYSFLGYLTETVFAFLVYGVIESRQSFLYGPFCAIYGIGAVIMISLLRHFNKNNYTLFLGGYVIGSVIEYLTSWIGEMLLHTTWWDYSNRFLNINGRICLTYSIFWGLIAVYLMKSFNPLVDRFIDWFSSKINKTALKIIIAIVTVFLILDATFSAFAHDWTMAKVAVEKNLDVKDKAVAEQKYNEVYSDAKKAAFVDKYWSTKKMLYVYPNLKTTLADGEKIFIRDLYPEIHPYLYKRNAE